MSLQSHATLELLNVDCLASVALCECRVPGFSPSAAMESALSVLVKLSRQVAFLAG